MMNKLSVLFLLALTSCSTQPTCGQKAWEAAGNAMSNVQYNLNRYNDRNAMVNCSSANGCPIMPLKSGYDTGDISGQYSQTGYRGLNARQAYDKAIETCQAKTE